MKKTPKKEDQLAEATTVNPSPDLKPEVKLEDATSMPIQGQCVECGKPVAEGQNSVCKDHIRTG